jgi:hypothetical protein
MTEMWQKKTLGDPLLTGRAAEQFLKKERPGE